MSVGFLFPGSKMIIRSFKELKLRDPDWGIWLWQKKKKHYMYYMIQVNAEDLKKSKLL